MRQIVLVGVFTASLALRGDGRFLSVFDSDGNIRRIPRLQTLLQSANSTYMSSDFPGALALYQRGLEMTPASAPYYRAAFLTGAGNALGMTWRFQDALRSFNKAYDIAARYGLSDLRMKSAVGRISIYRHIPGVASENHIVDEAEAVMRDTYEPPSIIQVANLIRDIRPEKARELYRVALVRASLSDDVPLLAMIWNQLGYSLLEQRDLDGAEQALTEAYRLRWLSNRAQLQSTCYYLGWLRRLQKRPTEAIELLTRAREMSGYPGGVYAWSVERELARSTLAAGDLKGAMVRYESAIELAQESRISNLPADSFRTAVEEGLHGLFSEYVELGMREYEATRDPRLARKMLQAAEASRAAIFQSAIPGPSTLPDSYVSKVAEYRRALARSLSADPDQHDPRRLGTLRLQLANLEMELGIAQPKFSPKIFENNVTGNALRDVRNFLRESEVLLSFLSGPNGSIMWAVTRDSFEVHTLPPSAVLRERVNAYRKSLEKDGSAMETPARRLAEIMFRGLSPKVWSKPDWIFSLDDPLFDAPLASLPDLSVTESGERSYLGETRSIRLTPAAPQPGGDFDGASQRFTGIADPVYNRADTRGGPVVRETSFENGEPELPRLPGTAREIRRCSVSWSRDRSPALLTGPEVGREVLVRELRRSPAVLHLGFHVVRHPVATEEVMIALGRKKDGESDYLTPTEIAKWRFSLGLVTLSGCGSGTGQARPGLGMFGLTRAWLTAGARSVLASYWPIRDDDGGLLATLYAELDKRGGHVGSLDVARALQEAQRQFRRRGTGWQAQPSYWAAFFVVGRE